VFQKADIASNKTSSTFHESGLERNGGRLWG